MKRQGRALGRHLQPGKVLHRTIERYVEGRLFSKVTRRIALPDRVRDDVSIDGAWRFSESVDGSHAWYSDRRHPARREATGRALAAYRWNGVLLDHLRPLSQLTRFGCTVRDGGLQMTARGETLPTIQIAMSGLHAETVFLDEAGRIVACHTDLPPIDEEDRELEICIDEWAKHNGLVYPLRSSVLDRNEGTTIAELVVTDIRTDRLSESVFDLSSD